MLVLDSYALITYFKQQPGWLEVEALLKEAVEKDRRMLMSLINWGEIIYTRATVAGTEAALLTERTVDKLPVDIVIPDRDTTRQAAILKAMGGISYADCFAAALAMKEKATLVTGDKEFRRLEKKGFIKVKWI